MGVTGLWTVVSPTARPTKLETLNRKRLAVDASIWIYQFLKAVRDKEGHGLRNSHVVGFFRRICKLLYFGIKPVFVFDGGAPVLKRETIRKRVRRREGRRDDAARTAGKLLAVQVARAAEDEAKRQREAKDRRDEEELPDEKDLVYVDELGMDEQQRRANRAFRKQDQYHLPDLHVNLEEMGAPNDPRVMSQAELEEYAKQFHSGEDVNLYDFSKIDFDSPFFQSLPPGDKYNILNAARLRSRLRMGYSKEQLDGMFPDRMAFSRFQIERVKERNELTQRLMHISGMNEGDWNMGGRIAGERGAEYVLVRNEGVEGGWALGVVSNRKGSKKDNAIDLDEDDVLDNDESSEENDDFEDVEIEGINRIPQSWKRKRHQLREVDYDISYEEAAERIAKKRKAVYEARKTTSAAIKPTTVKIDSPPSTADRELDSSMTKDDAMFVEQERVNEPDEDEVFEDVDVGEHNQAEEDELQKAIAMSLEKTDDQGGFINERQDSDELHVENSDPGDGDDDFDLQAVLAKSRSSKQRKATDAREKSPQTKKASQFTGPLPFESLNLGQSLLGKKKAKKAEENLSGGFDRRLGDGTSERQRKAQPIPDWFSQAPDIRPQRPADMDQAHDSDDHVTYGQEDLDRRETLRSRPSKDIIDLESDEEEPHPYQASQTLEANIGDWNTIDDTEELKRQEEEDKKALEAEDVASARRKALEEEREKRYEMARQIAAENEESEDDLTAVTAAAEPVQVSPEPDSAIQSLSVTQSGNDLREEVEWSESDDEQPSRSLLLSPKQPEITADNPKPPFEPANQDEDDMDDLFEDVGHMTESQALEKQQDSAVPAEQAEPIDQSLFMDADDDEEAEADSRQHSLGHPRPRGEEDKQEDFFEDDSDEELMRQLANEAEEHLRFANELNNTRPKSPTQAMRDYENELKQLRNQQKKDRRDADEVTQTMIQECQALLRLFGLPYITAPMEAEAQCAELVHLGLVDGIVTDDSDIFLFGGTRIYKNMFNAAKFVECYLANDLEKEYALDRRKLIRFAHLLGSDYTEGIPGIGPVTALEIISDFEDLSEFKEWTLKVQLGVQTPSVMEGLLNTAFKRKFKRTVQRKLFLPTNFPDLRVDQAYLEPDVDSNSEEFQWGVPDLDKLRTFLMATIGWSQERTDEILVPVVRDMNKREVDGVQSNITKFFAGGVGAGAAQIRGRGINGYNGPANSTDVVEGTAPRNRTGKESGRMKNAYTRLRGEAEKRKRAALTNSEIEPRTIDETSEDALNGNNDDDTIDGVDEMNRETENDNKNSLETNIETSSKTVHRRAKKQTKSKSKQR